MTADEAAKKLVEWMNDPEVPFGVRAKIAQDLMDRAGLVAAQVHHIVPMEKSPVMEMYERLLSDPSNLERIPDVGDDRNPDGTYPVPMRDQIALEGAVGADVITTEQDREPEPVVEDGSDTPPKIKRLADAGAFARQPRS
jgi:hypothetical protein